MILIGPGRISSVQGADEASDAVLRVQLRALWRRRWYVVAATVLALAGGLGLAGVQSPLYRADVKLLLQPSVAASLTGTASTDQLDPSRNVQNQIDVMQSATVEARVRQVLRWHGPVPVTVTGDPTTSDVIDVAATAGTGRRAEAVARTYAATYVSYRRAQLGTERSSAIRDLQGQVKALQGQIDRLDTQVARANAAGVSGVQSAAALSIERDQLLTEQAPLQRRLQDLQVSAGLPGGDVQLLGTGPLPVTKVRPKPVRDAMVAGALGLVAGLGLALLREYLDDSLREKEDLERAMPGLPVLALLPRVPHAPSADHPLLVTGGDGNAAAAEAYRTLRTALHFVGRSAQAGQHLRSGGDVGPAVLQLTSPNAGDGKTTVVGNVGMALAQVGQRVIIVDCDLRRARLHELFGLSAKVGVTSVLTGRTSLASAVQPVPAQEGLSLLSAGPLPPNPAELVSLPSLGVLLDELRSQFDAVLVDSPPVLPVSDPVALAACVDSTVVVVRAGRTSKRDFQRAVELLRQADAPLVGALLNQVEPQTGYGYGYGYSAISPVEEDAGADYGISSTSS